METEAVDTTYQTPPPEQYSQTQPADPPPASQDSGPPPEQIQDEDLGNNVDLLV
ncbi:MAG: hypothetical protein JW874_00035 [Spirochaetales bacterium]|nr:hypothetical protein [Spirochaetales bacterium]